MKFRVQGKSGVTFANLNTNQYKSMTITKLFEAAVQKIIRGSVHRLIPEHR